LISSRRYYGASLPFGNAFFSSPGALSLLTVEQALADLAEATRALPALLG